MKHIGRHGFRSDIQGLRAIAVLSVLIYHAYAGRWLPGGFVGVDIFFVISGFLISRILFKENDQSRFTVLGFYRRRFRRLTPALLVVLLFTLACGAVILSPHAYRELSETALATVLFVSNFALWKLTGYFNGNVAYKPLLHTWSLAVEEQFYIIYPLLVYLLYRFWRRWMGPALAVLAALSFVFSALSSANHPDTCFYLLPARAFELLLGALTAHYIPQTNRLRESVRDALSVFGILLIAASLVLIRETMVFPGAIALIPCLGTALVIAAGHDRKSLGGRIISFAPFVFFGDISYSLYLWHWPLLSLAHNWLMGPLSIELATALALLSIGAAYASWRWIERPFINGFANLKVITTGLTSMACLVAICGTIFLLHGLPNRYDPQSRAYFAASADYSPMRARCHSDNTSSMPYDKSCVLGAQDAAPSVAVWADSHGVEVAAALGEKLAVTHNSLIEITSSSCPPVLHYSSRERPNCARHNDEIALRLAKDQRIRQVVVLADFSDYPTAQDTSFQQGFEEAMRSLSNAGKHVIIFDPIPVFGFDVPDALGLIHARGGNPRDFGLPLADYRKENEPYVSLIAKVAEETGAEVLPTTDLLCGQGICPTLNDHQQVLYFNANHLSMAGTRRLLAGIPLNVFTSPAQAQASKHIPGNQVSRIIEPK